MTPGQGNRPPRGWELSTLGEISEKPEYGWTTSASKSGFLRLLRTTDITKDTLDWAQVPFCENSPPDVSRFKLRPGDIVISRAGSVGVSALIDECPDAVFASYLIRFRPLAGLSRKYIAYFLQSPDYWRQIAESAAGIALQNVNAKKLAAIPIAIAPLSEQQRIVEEIEKQFTRLDAAVAALKRIQANLKRYRAAVLKAACEGRLVPTEAELARREGRSYEPASVLLERILAERRSRWEAAQKTKYREPLISTPAELPSLPEGWTWANWEQVSSRVTVGHVGPMKNEYVPDGFPFLRSQNVRENAFDAEGLLHIPREFHRKLSKSVICAGDLVVVRSGSVGTTCVVPDHLGEANCADLVIIKRPIQTNPWYGCYYMNSSAKRYVHAGKVGVALTHFNTKSVAQLPVALPPRPEQDRIVAEIQRRLSVIDEIEMQVDADLKRANNLRQTILKRAFEGQLVPQDSNDEPARVLLDRIRADCVRRGEGQNGNRKRRQKLQKSELASA